MSGRLLRRWKIVWKVDTQIMRERPPSGDKVVRDRRGRPRIKAARKMTETTSRYHDELLECLRLRLAVREAKHRVADVEGLHGGADRSHGAHRVFTQKDRPFGDPEPEVFLPVCAV